MPLTQNIWPGQWREVEVKVFAPASNQNALNTSKVTDSVSASLFESVTICLASQSHGSEVSLFFNETLLTR